MNFLMMRWRTVDKVGTRWRYFTAKFIHKFFKIFTLVILAIFPKFMAGKTRLCASHKFYKKWSLKIFEFPAKKIEIARITFWREI